MTTVLLTILVTVSLSIGVHHEVFSMLVAWLPRVRLAPRRKILVGILAAVVAHLVEIGIFAAGYVFLDERPGLGDLVGPDFGGGVDYYYFSAVTYTTLGFGDITPHGPLRLLVGIEALIGLVLITWSASFTYLHTARYWEARRPAGRR